MSFVFISYSRTNSNYVDRLANSLLQHGIEYWFDRELQIGTQWWNEIERQITRCAALIVIVTPDDLKSHWIEREILLAEKLHKPVIPLLLEGAPSSRLADLHHENVHGGRMPSPAFYQRLSQLVSGYPSYPIQTTLKEEPNIDQNVLYGTTPHQILIHYPVIEDFVELVDHLRDMGFAQLKGYAPSKLLSPEYQERFSEGIVIFLARSDREAKDNDDLMPLIEYTRHNNPDKLRVAYLIYVEGYNKKVSELIKVFKDVVIANFPATLITQIYALARILKPIAKAD